MIVHTPELHNLSHFSPSITITVKILTELDMWFSHGYFDKGRFSQFLLITLTFCSPYALQSWRLRPRKHGTGSLIYSKVTLTLSMCLGQTKRACKKQWRNNWSLLNSVIAIDTFAIILRDALKVNQWKKYDECSKSFHSGQISIYMEEIMKENEEAYNLARSEGFQAMG